MTPPVLRRARVPGKLMLCGEYAVLAGAPAIVTCVDRYVTASAAPASGEEATVSLRGFGGTRHVYRMVAGVPRWSDAASAPTLVDAVLRSCRPEARSIEIDSAPFYDAGRKLGLGSSAAVAVALSAVLGDGDGVADALPLALAAHRDFQGGRGSGADVRAVAHGGTIVQRTEADGVAASSLPWPEGLHARAVMTTQAAATVDHVARFENWRRRDGAARALLVAAATAAAQVVVEWQQADAAAIIAAMNRFTQEIGRIDAAAGLGYAAGGHEQLAGVAAAHGCSYKPCGAGGGDLGIAFAASPGALDAFAAGAVAAGFTVPALELGQARPELLREASA